jgi:hypothetical protein
MNINRLRIIAPAVPKPTSFATISHAPQDTAIQSIFSFLNIEEAINFSSLSRTLYSRTSMLWPIVAAHNFNLDLESIGSRRRIICIYRISIIQLGKIVEKLAESIKKSEKNECKAIFPVKPKGKRGFDYYKRLLNCPQVKSFFAIYKDHYSAIHFNSSYLPEEFVIFKEVKTLTIHAQHLSKLPQCFSQFKNLTIFLLNAPELWQLPRNFFTSHPNLTSLHLSCPIALMNNPPTLAKTNLKISALSIKMDCQTYHLPSFITYCNALEYLLIEGLAQDDRPSFKLPDILLVSEIKTLRLMNTRVKVIPNWISQMTQLEYLDLEEEDCIQRLPEELALTPKLINVYIRTEMLNDHSLQVVKELEKKGVYINLDEGGDSEES